MTEPGPVARYSAKRLKRNWWLFAPIAGMLFALCLGWLFKTDLMMRLPMLTTHPLLFSLFGGLILYRRNPWPDKVAGTLEANARGLYFEGEQVAAKANIKNADVTTDNGASVLRIRRQRQAEERFQLDDSRTERAFLYALGFDTLQHAAEYRGASRVHAHPWKLVAGIITSIAMCVGLGALLAMAGIKFAGPSLVVLFVLGMLVVQLLPAKIRVGADGVNVRWAGRERYFPSAEIVSVQETTVGSGKNRHTAVCMFLRDGERYVMPIGQKTYGRGDESALQKRIQHIIDVRGDGRSLGEQLQRRGRTARDWYNALRGAGNSATNLRSAHVETGDLWKVVENVKSRVEERVAAAIALRERLTPAERPRLQRVAQATAEPRIRIAFDRIADDTAAEEELIATLESTTATSD